MKYPALSRYSLIDEAIATCKRLINAFNNSALVGDAYLVKIFNRLQAAINAIMEALEEANPHSELKRLNEIRGNLIRQIEKILDGYAVNPDPIISAAAIELKNAFDNAGGLSMLRHNYGVTSGKIDTYLNTVYKPEAVANIALCPGLGSVIDQLTTAQQEFEDHRTSREYTDGSEENNPTAFAKKNEAIHIVNELLGNLLRSLGELEGGDWEEFALGTSTIIDDNNRSVNIRLKKDEDENPDEPGDDTPTDPTNENTNDTPPSTTPDENQEEV